jgi:probable phosphoglycerate mutase
VKLVYLARHGETDWNRVRRWQGATDVALNDDGRAQARALAERLRGLDIACVHASDLARARETAEIVAAHLPSTFAGASPRFRERGFGIFEGLTAAECEARHGAAWRAYLTDFRNTPPSGEPADRVVARMLEGVRAVAAETPTLVVSHGACIRMLLSSVGRERLPAIANAAVFRLSVRADEILGFEEL